MRDDGRRGRVRQRGKQWGEVRAFVGKDPVSGKKQYVTKTIRGERREAEVALGRMRTCQLHAYSLTRAQ
ncbi:MAG: hypothetical protein JWO37_1752 [Acidimicrobiales bacterium]|jgi:hypothetical protein|nr:hypothetical protein [Acidimicrobiales bacterium]